MNLIIIHVRIPIEKDGMAEYLRAAARKLKIGEGSITVAAILSKSLDATSKEQFFYKLSIVVSTPRELRKQGRISPYTQNR